MKISASFNATRVVVVLLACIIAVPASAAMDQPGRDELNRFSADLQTMQARFEQRVIRNDGGIENESSGEVWLPESGTEHVSVIRTG